MPTNNDRKSGPPADEGSETPAHEQWEPGVLWFIYRLFTNRQTFENLMRFLGQPIVAILIVALAAAASALCAEVVATLAHQPTRIRWFAAGSAGGVTGVPFLVRILYRKLRHGVASESRELSPPPHEGHRDGTRRDEPRLPRPRSLRDRRTAAAKPSSAEAPTAQSDQTT